VSAWYLLWMLVDVLGIVVLLASLIFTWSYATESDEMARGRQYDWREERRRRREFELYGRLLEPCFYCGIECAFGPDCANRHLKPKAES
jgi:hypothetical protein